MNRILLEPHEVLPDGRVLLQNGRARHIREVLKAALGQRLRVGLLEGPRGTGEVVAVEGERVWLRCVWEAEIPPRPAVDLVLAMPRPKVMRRLWAPLAAMGVGRICVIGAERVERGYLEARALDPKVYRPLLIEGLQQAGDTRVPQVTVHPRFRVFVERELDEVLPQGVRLVADPREERTVTDVMREHGVGGGNPRVQRVVLAVGPEGGWASHEREMLSRRKFVGVRWGRRTLRSDAACLALLAIVHEMVGD